MLKLETAHQVYTFNSPLQALADLEDWVPEVVISDFLMPEMDGLTCLKAVKEKLPDASLMMLTGYADKENAIQAINDLGLFHYIEKPWDNERLKLTIQNGIDRTRLLSGLRRTMMELAQRKEIERLREDFVSTLTHDLRVPLLAAIQTLGLLKAGNLGDLAPRQHEIVGMLMNSQEDLLGLVNALLEVYRYEAGRQPLVFEPIHLKPLLTGVVHELQALAQRKNHQLVLHLAEDLPPIRGDKLALRRLLTNLVGNAIQYTPSGGTIELKACRDGLETVLLSVEDNGYGIPEADLPFLFQRFSQGGTRRQRTSGTGLGLYLSRQIAEAHHGHIGVDSLEGKGSRFYVSLPVVASLPEALSDHPIF